MASPASSGRSTSVINECPALVDTICDMYWQHIKLVAKILMERPSLKNDGTPDKIVHQIPYQSVHYELTEAAAVLAPFCERGSTFLCGIILLMIS